MGTENILWKFELNQIIYPEFKVIESLKYKAIRMIGVKHFYAKFTQSYWVKHRMEKYIQKIYEGYVFLNELISQFDITKMNHLKRKER